MVRRLVAEVLKDSLSRRWSLPQVRGLLTAWQHADRIFALPLPDLAAWYPAFQQAFLAGDSIKVFSAQDLQPGQQPPAEALKSR